MILLFGIAALIALGLGVLAFRIDQRATERSTSVSRQQRQRREWNAGRVEPHSGEWTSEHADGYRRLRG